MKHISFQAFAAASIAAAFLWSTSAYVIYSISMPLRPSGNGTSMVFDPVALAYATSIIVAVAILSWLPVLLFLRKRPAVHVALLSSVSTFASLGAVFLLVENVVGAPRFSDGFYARTTNFLANGSDMAFLPLVNPLISALSGIAYTVALSLSILFSRRNKAAGGSPGEEGAAES